MKPKRAVLPVNPDWNLLRQKALRHYRRVKDAAARLQCDAETDPEGEVIRIFRVTFPEFFFDAG
ncbi:MAG: hypothetical protein KIT22_12545 [Verrucomicrobiae bacterium]|nr:hypothetical protein [Verrucomicrobiae bacterium]